MSALSAVHTTPSSNEQQLITAVRRGDDRAFEELYARYRSRISSYVLGMVGDHQRAEDIAQEVFIAALRRLRATERPIAFKPWIYEIAKNACIDDFRRSKRAREISLDVDEEAETPPAPLISHGADTAVEHKQRLDDLRGAFGGLSEAHHRIIVMRELEGRSYSQIGASLGMSKPVVESTLFRARRKLSEEYEELVTGRRCERVQTVITADGEKPLRRLGVKERRLLARHLAHCQPCRRHARMAGVDDSFFKTPSIAAKIAALFPLPFLRFRRGHGGGASSTASPGRSVSAVQSLQSAAAYVDPSGPADGLSRAAAAVAAIVVAGAGGGLVSGITNHNQMPRPRVVHTAPARATTHSSGSPAPAAAARAAHAIAVPPTVWGSSGSSASSSGSRQIRHRNKRTTGSGGGSGQSGSSHATSGAGGSSSSGATSKANSGATGAPSASTVTSGAGSALHNPVSAAAGVASRLLGGASSGSGSSGSSGSGIQLPRIGPVQLPKISLPSGSSSTSTTPSSSSSPLPVPLPKIPGAPDPTKVIQGLTGH